MILEFLLVINDVPLGSVVCTLSDMCYFTVSYDKFFAPKFLADAGSR